MIFVVRVEVWDLEFCNGIFVNGKCVECAVIGFGDVLWVGGFFF